MRMLVFLMFCLASLGATVHAAEPVKSGKVRVLVTFGGHGFEQEKFFAMFDAMTDVKYTKAPLPQSAELLKPGLEKDHDVIVMYDMIHGISPAQQKAFVALLNKGIGVVALHHNLAAHRDWDEFRKIIGGKFFLKEQTIDGQKRLKSTTSMGQEISVTVADPQHPITKGLKDFTIHDETYHGYYTAPNVRVLLKTDHPKNDPEIAWAHQYGKSRVFYFMLGHDSRAWTNPSYPEILARGIRWAAAP